MNRTKYMFSFEIWQDCNQKCSFCLNEQNTATNTKTETKIQYLETVISAIDTYSYLYKDYNLSISGGEFFQGQLKSVKQHWWKLIDKVNATLENNPTMIFHMNAALLQKDQTDLWDTINKLDKTRLTIITSWDYKGRFHSDAMKQTWEQNVKQLRENDIKVEVGIIASKDLINAVLDNKLNLKYFNNINPCFMIEFPKLNEDNLPDKDKSNLPTRANYIKWFNVLKQNHPDIFTDLYKWYFLKRYIYDVPNNTLDTYFVDYAQSGCQKHKESIFNGYSDSEHCIICDLENMRD